MIRFFLLHFFKGLKNLQTHISQYCVERNNSQHDDDDDDDVIFTKCLMNSYMMTGAFYMYSKRRVII